MVPDPAGTKAGVIHEVTESNEPQRSQLSSFHPAKPQSQSHYFGALECLPDAVPQIRLHIFW